MRTVFVGDVHGKPGWRALDPDDWDRLVFLGDYVDARATAETAYITPEYQLWNLHEIIRLKKTHPERVVLLLGNHDMQYLAPGAAGSGTGRSAWVCSGYQPGTADDFARLLQRNSALFQGVWCNPDGDVLVSHAGFNLGWLRATGLLRYVGELPHLVRQCNELYESCDAALTSTGWRGLTKSDDGSPIWSDITETDANRVDGWRGKVAQVVGHTRCGDAPMTLDGLWDVDCLQPDGGFFLSHDSTKQDRWEVVKASTEAPKSVPPASERYVTALEHCSSAEQYEQLEAWFEAEVKKESMRWTR